MNTLTADNDALKSRVSVMEENINSVQKHNTDFNKVIKNNFINEVIVRQSRQKNILLFNLPEIDLNSDNTLNDYSTFVVFINS